MATLQVTSVTKAYGQKRLFEAVDVVFNEERRYGLTGPNGAGKSTFMKIADRRARAARRHASSAPAQDVGVLRQDQFAFDNDPRPRRRGAWATTACGARLQENARRLRTRPTSPMPRAMRLGELEAIVGDEDGYTAESERRRCCCRASTFRSELHERTMSEIAGRPESARAPRAGALRQAAGAACSTSRPTTSTSTRSTGCERFLLVATTGTLVDHLARPALSERASARTSRTSTTRPSSPTPAATTTW